MIVSISIIILALAGIVNIFIIQKIKSDIKFLFDQLTDAVEFLKESDCITDKALTWAIIELKKIKEEVK